MDKSSRLDIPLDDQRRSWNYWNIQIRERRAGIASEREAAVILGWLAGRRDLAILDAGCGAGWMSERLAQFGRVTGVDIADSAIERARQRLPQHTFHVDDVTTAPLPAGTFDLVVALELLSHVADQSALIAQFARVLKPGGQLMLATQNRRTLERWSAVGGPNAGQIRRWVDAPTLRRLLQPCFHIETLISVVPVGDQGVLRIVNSHKLNRLVGAVTGADRLEKLKERCLLGHTLIVRARKR